MQLAKRLDGIGEYYFSLKLREIEQLNNEGKNIINLGIGSPDMPPHPGVIKTLQQESAKPNVHAYQSYKGSPVLRSAMSEWYKKWYNVELNPDTEILPLIGSKEGIMHICMTYFQENVGVLVPNPGYPTYSSAVKLSGAEPLSYSLLEKNNYEPDFEELEKIMATSSFPVKGLFVNYPQMPTGQLPTKNLFERLVAFARTNDILVIHDNPYSFILNDTPLSLLSVDRAKDHVIELNSLSKSHNMAGWRVGMLLGTSERVDEVLRYKSNMDSGMFLPVQLAAAKALALGKDWYEQVNSVYRQRKARVYELLDLMQCSYSKSQAGLFVWAKISERFRDCYECSDSVLRNAHVFVTPGGIFGTAGQKYIRVSLCATEEKINEAINRISK
ncbi:MAG TPA: aminotransferase class I/II-fold pyridoxal phosphate-dependent enzyme [Chitinophagaceae bacterium]|nr:aminotransferase class I/II-fold pyridoxal phosphate-dependent enzyme [Chitinophagaceae bacterium]